MKIFRHVWVLFLLITHTNVFGQSQIDGETSFLFFLKVFNKDLNEAVKKTGWGATSWLEFYAQGIDKFNFETVKNDEFKRNKYYSQTREKIKNKINALNFKKEYYIMSESQFGEYDFTTNSFPITSIFQGPNFKAIPLANSFKVPLKIGWIINQNCFDYKIKLSADKAEKFINNRKSTSGNIDRRIETKIFFSFVNQPLYNGKAISWEHEFINTELIVYVTRLEFYNKGQLLSSLLPTIKFEDPVSGFKVLNGNEIINYNAEYSDGPTIVVNRVNGLPNGPVRYYNSYYNRLERIVNCSYFFPNVIKFSGDDVKLIGDKDKEIPLSITQYNKDGQLEGYDIRFDGSNNLALKSVIKIDEKGGKIIITEYSVFTGFKKVKDMPTDVQELIKKYDYGKFFKYSENIGNLNTENNKVNSDFQKVYVGKTVKIGNQVWMSENLNVSTYRNGDPIPQVTDPTVWAALTTGAYCYYNNDSATYAATYGKLYNWYAVNDPRGLVPIGWHIPSKEEWETLFTYFGGNTLAGDAMKEVGAAHWQNPNTQATNSSGFTGLPGGCRFENGMFGAIGGTGYWWSSTQNNVRFAWFPLVSYNSSDAHMGFSDKIRGLSIRCLRN